MPEPTLSVKCTRCGADSEPLVTDHGDKIKCSCQSCDSFICFVTEDEEDFHTLKVIAKIQAEKLKGEARL